MNISCENCRSKFKIPDEKVPKGQMFSLTCPQCNTKVVVNARSNTHSLSDTDSKSLDKPKPEKEETMPSTQIDPALEDLVVEIPKYTINQVSETH